MALSLDWFVSLEALNNSSLNSQNKQSKRRDFYFASFFKHMKCLKNVGISLCRQGDYKKAVCAFDVEYVCFWCVTRSLPRFYKCTFAKTLRRQENKDVSHGGNFLIKTLDVALDEAQRDPGA